MSERDDSFEAGIRRVLDEEAARLDDGTRARLRAARRLAVEASVARRASGLRWVAPAGAVFASAVLALVLWSRQELAAPAIAPGDFELLTSRDAPELYQELDFYLWLARERDHAG